MAAEIEDISTLSDAVTSSQIKVICLEDVADAMTNNDSKRFSEVLDLGLDPNFLCDNKDHKKIPLLHLAAQQGNLEISTLLLKRGAKVDTKDHEGLNALYKAYDAYKKDQDKRSKFMKARIVRSLMYDYTTIYPLHEAIREGNTQEIRRLLDIGADIEFSQYTEASKRLLSLGAREKCIKGTSKNTILLINTFENNRLKAIF